MMVVDDLTKPPSFAASSNSERVGLASRAASLLRYNRSFYDRTPLKLFLLLKPSIFEN